jgi:hypothetical protein
VSYRTAEVQFRQSIGRRTSAVGSRYQRTRDDSADSEDPVRAIVKCRCPARLQRYTDTQAEEEFLTYAVDMGLAEYIHTKFHTNCSDILKLIAGTHRQHDDLISLFFFSK